MEIALVGKNSFRIKGKQGAFVINPSDKLTGYQAAVLLKSMDQLLPKLVGEMVVIYGAGEYEIAGIKLTGIPTNGVVVYSMNIDGVDVLIGTFSALEKAQHKLKEHAVVVMEVEAEGDSSFISSLAMNAVLMYGEKAQEVITAYAKEGVQEMNKYTTTKDKLPQEMDKILLQ